MIFCNGFPKSGNHALMKAVELLGFPASVNHHNYAEGIPDEATHHIFIKRDPRNVIVSWLRFHGDLVTPGKFMARFRRFSDRTAVQEMAEYEEWLPRAFVIRYEDLTGSDQCMREIARYIGVKYQKGAFEQLENHTPTWNAVKSDYRTIWTPDVEEMWTSEGGPELLTRWGYGISA